MSFSDYKSVEQLIDDYPLALRSGSFLPNVRLALPSHFVAALEFALRRESPGESEHFYTENFVYPLLFQAWNARPKVHLWSHRAIVADNRLQGTPDYLVSAFPTKAVRKLVQAPLLAVIEAKRQDFEEGWGQCLAAMLASQKLNEKRPVVVYGAVSTGTLWQFGKLEGETFSREPSGFAISDPERVFGLIDHVFGECERQIDLSEAPVASTD